jgi:hypothetical protein
MNHVVVYYFATETFFYAKEVTVVNISFPLSRPKPARVQRVSISGRQIARVCNIISWKKDHLWTLTVDVMPYVS